MKTPFLEKSTLKWILAWLATCWIFFLGVFAAEVISLDSFKIVSPNRLLEQEKWNGLIWAMWGFVSAVNGDLRNAEIPAWTVIIFDWAGGCPSWWSQWNWWWEGKFLMPLQPGQTPKTYGGSSSFIITNENLPKHSHTIMYGGYDSQWLSATRSLAVKNVQDGTTNHWDSDYNLVWSEHAPTVGKTSEEWGTSKPISFTPEYVRVLFCIKNAS